MKNLLEELLHANMRLKLIEHLRQEGNSEACETFQSCRDTFVRAMQARELANSAAEQRLSKKLPSPLHQCISAPLGEKENVCGKKPQRKSSQKSRNALSVLHPQKHGT